MGVTASHTAGTLNPSEGATNASGAVESSPTSENAVDSPSPGGEILTSTGSSLGSIVPTTFTWAFGGSAVLVTGAWDNWNAKVALARVGHEHMAILSLPIGSYQYKFIVDGNWRHSPALPTETDQHGNLNNVVTISPHFPEYDSNVPLEGPSGPPSPIESYDFSMPAREDYSVEPAVMPPLFKAAPLNPRTADSVSLNPTAYVCLNHLFCAAPDHPADQTRTIATVQRYKANKYVTTVMIVNATSMVRANHIPVQHASMPVLEQTRFSNSTITPSTSAEASVVPTLTISETDNQV